MEYKRVKIFYLLLLIGLLLNGSLFIHNHIGIESKSCIVCKLGLSNINICEKQNEGITRTEIIEEFLKIEKEDKKFNKIKRDFRIRGPPDIHI